MNSKEKLEVIVKAADSKRAHNIVALNVHEVSLMADYFVIMDAASNRQVKSIAEEIADQSEEAGISVKEVEGKDTAKWILLDLGDVIVHVFQEDEREYYNLEKLWSDADSVDVSEWVKD
ncbi:Ribosomal silencing factor RsfS [Apilactobacillus kunkeei]|uniref:Ribosomal silencing factor RsfS n=1 Tax=Apilactobacillus kunkeei DSM 12361 = ATCC 700308 TaxID=1423768 RepID=A0A0R1FSM2_9LACO|nr:ribosome silencing factor [Apilactobacillus kunkeei]KOY72925.1 Iojap-like protein [Apilactobacillus kunkeei DSM 12361 = ATCC 700308]KPN82708.1 Iojap-like protein [Apilactobacillus kunkeei]KRK24821.1 Iojap-related protein [Apilactobacillus kunkeei DSM 12361 = ATCC 700308]MCK8619412.1 ribosome silencing factor [Apilactobacillus kunkeei]MCK8625796.1 ribosome silencing factor [Apilactobacillus kunkeei]